MSNGCSPRAARFDAEASTQQFVIHAADYGQQLLGPAIATELAERAPNNRLHLRPLSDELITGAAGVGRVVAVVRQGHQVDPMNQERLANRIASGEGSACWSVPSKSSGSPRRSGGTLEHDSGHIWFRSILERAGRRIEAELP